MHTNAMPARLLGLALCVAGIVLLRKGSINLGAGAFVLGLTVVSTAYRSKKPPVEVRPVFVKNLVIVLATWIGLGYMVFMAARSASIRLASGAHHDLTKGVADVVLMVVGGYFYWAFAAGSRIALTTLARHLRSEVEHYRV
ncbi:MAG TPA: hypothetical protein VK662_15150 [Acidothermaceae bacterium]|nr:hypothetical protein [Acidothermaceae bacterium]